MDDTDLSRRIIHCLGNEGSLNDLILEICEERNLTWPQAEALVESIRVRQEHAIARRKFPLLFVIALGIFFLGLALVVYDSYILAKDMAATVEQIRLNTGNSMVLRLIVDFIMIPISGITIGTAMMVGSMIGMRRAWSPLLEGLIK